MKEIVILTALIISSIWIWFFIYKFFLSSIFGQKDFIIIIMTIMSAVSNIRSLFEIYAWYIYENKNKIKLIVTYNIVEIIVIWGWMFLYKFVVLKIFGYSYESVIITLISVAFCLIAIMVFKGINEDLR